jgi:hypothetical protein
LRDDSPQSLRNTLLSLKKILVKKLEWSLYEIDETDFCNLLAFIQFQKEDPNIRIINGKEYKRATKPPSWL